MTLATLALLLAAQPLLPRAAVPPAQRAPTPAATAPSDEQFLHNAQLDTSGPGLLDFFRRRAAGSVDRERLAALTRQLSDRAPAVHDKAASELIALGPVALPALRRAVNHVDEVETAARARKCLESIEGKGGANLVQAAVRLLAERTPAGAAEVLLEYLPFADDEAVVQEIETALLAVGRRDGKAESALARALTDPTPIRRSIAARVLCQVGGKTGRASVRPLLKDPRPTVRMQAALGLADVEDAEAVPVLIDLVADLPPEGRRQVEVYLTELAGEWAVKTPQGNDATSGRLRRELWSAWWRSLDGQHLLDEFRGRTLSDDERARVLESIEKLTDVSPDVRARASEEIVNLGPRVTALLRQIVGRAEPSLAGPVRRCLEAIERDAPRPLPDAAPRLLVLRRPEGTLEALLGYLPFAENDASASQLTELLAIVGCADGKPEPALLRALQDRVSTRRAAAAVALCKAGAEDALPAVRKLLNDPDTLTRMKTALALVQRGDRSAMPVVIALLNDLPLDQVWEVEDLLVHLASEKGPAERIGNDAASRVASVAAWKTWWSKQEASIDLARLASANRDRGLLLVIEQQGAKGQGRVLELSSAGKVRWQVEGLMHPWDAQVCPNGHILVVEQQNRVSERDRQGKVIWQKACNNPFSCQRLRNGHIFVLGRNQLFELDATGKELFTHHFPGHIVGGRKFPDGQMAFITYQGQYVRLDATGKQVKTFQVPFQWQNGVIGAEVLPGDRLVVSLGVGKVAEYADGGKLVWETNVVGPGFPHRLLNGRTLVSSNNNTMLLELDRAGKVVAEKKDLGYRPYRTHRR
jgi:HEAT repeat protein